MLLKGYLPLNEYSSRFRVSLSTLRRRIRAGEIEYRFEGGKYWLAEKPPTKYGHIVGQQKIEPESTQEPKREVQSLPAESLLDSAQKMVQELKSAYVSVLHEKEKQITELKEEVSDLKTLVTILETENERLRAL